MREGAESLVDQGRTHDEGWTGGHLPTPPDLLLEELWCSPGNATDPPTQVHHLKKKKKESLSDIRTDPGQEKDPSHLKDQAQAAAEGQDLRVGGVQQGSPLAAHVCTHALAIRRRATPAGDCAAPVVTETCRWNGSDLWRWS